MKIYTKYGDEGFTRLAGGKRVSKTNVRVQAYGTMDEVCSLLGVIVAEIRENDKLNKVLGKIRKECENIQQQLFDCGSDLAIPHGLREYKQKIDDVKWLEQRMDEYIPLLPKLEYFIIPGGSKISSMFHLIRSNTRNLERKMVAVIEENEKINKIGLQYINRLSDYFFVIACLVNLKLGINETVYKKSKKIFKVKNEK
ncbi:cob(I)yrinic acid a,c-diamide adenosyltransferase [Leptotrichia wadei]|uniref:Corrinoid adenosyltransferase n=1 Tax=Leptotrichia wadei (strain F0279) TaxID=888055 RepID=U2QC89_LEPWF|nr:cob(I)yrinic acid a,c-diamide adenosyltransferase [Leptotrichia wadei]ERK54031.1 ATP:cob(I)alamin adenosyltransferase [Leptotrichia wadei F0279]